jgi:cellulose synthase/poly-beta-1,6-N-acetylglucosamine synthase-like glycosyltransferase
VQSLSDAILLFSVASLSEALLLWAKFSSGLVSPVGAFIPAYAAAAVTAAAWGTGAVTIGVLAAMALAAELLGRRLGPFLSGTGRGLAIGQVATGVLILAWWAVLIAASGPGGITGALLWLWPAVNLFGSAYQLIDGYLYMEVVCRTSWTRPRSLYAERAPATAPKITVHVPCCSEPPELVISTLDCLSAQDYPSFEVVVIDNNTPDKALWQPVEDHCARLGEHFRFFHVDRLAGAKAGALNYALRQSAADASLVAVVDADYLTQPRYLSTLASCFSDPSLGFVQTRHDYRAWQGNSFQEACYWEYRYPYATYMLSRNERNAPILTGTMCLIRREALDHVRGWAEWCPTEDSELAIRLQAAGYRGLYVNESYGYGVIPEDFAGYKRQRFRWINGPTLELMRHWRLYLPRRRRNSSALTRTQRFLFAHHGFREVCFALSYLGTTPLAILAVVLAATGTTVPVPARIWVAIVLSLASAAIVRWCVMRYEIGCTLRVGIRAVIAGLALRRVRTAAVVAALAGRPRPWGRTSKFPAVPSRMQALASAAPESLTAVVWLACAAAAFVLARERPAGLLLALVVLLIARGTSYLAAPYLAVKADQHVRQSQHGRSGRQTRARNGVKSDPVREGDVVRRRSAPRP